MKSISEYIVYWRHSLTPFKINFKKIKIDWIEKNILHALEQK